MVAAAAAAGVGSEVAEVIPVAGAGVAPAVPPVLVPPPAGAVRFCRVSLQENTILGRQRTPCSNCAANRRKRFAWGRKHDIGRRSRTGGAATGRRMGTPWRRMHNA